MGNEYPGKSDHQRAAESLVDKAEQHLADCAEIIKTIVELPLHAASESLTTRPYGEMKELL